MKIKLKSDHTSLNVFGVGLITNDNITKELYDRVVGINPRHADYFEVTEESEVAIKEKPQRVKVEKSE